MSIDDHLIHIKSGILHADTPRSKIESMIRTALEQQNKGPLVLHFHGGLTTYRRGKEGAQRLLPIYQDAGAFPVFFVWESGLLDTITNNLGEISRERIFRIIWKRIRKTIERKLIQVTGGRDLGDLPQPDNNNYETEIDDAIARADLTNLMKQDLPDKARLTELSAEEIAMLEAELGFDFELAAEVENISNALRDPEDVTADLTSRSTTMKGSTATLIDPAALDQIIERPESGSRGLISMGKTITAVVKITAKVISRFVRGRDHGLHATIVEEILHALYLGNVGGTIWATMKKDTADSFGDDAQIEGGTAFIDTLKTLANHHSPPRIVLVGHSAGAVYISEFLKHAHAELPENFKFEIIYLAPAVTFQLAAKTFEKYHSRVSAIRMFTMTDKYEKQDKLVPVLYPHSLLYFVSGVVESDVDMPILGMERFYDTAKFPDRKFPNVAKVRNYMKEFSGAFVWSVNKGDTPGFNSESVKHGNFDNDETTLNSVAHLIRNGFE